MRAGDGGKADSSRSVLGGGQIGVLLSEPLNGGFQEGIMIERGDFKHDLMPVKRGESTLKGTALPAGRQAQGFSEDHTHPPTSCFPPVTEK